jgi:dUTP pyrophosphatase
MRVKVVNKSQNELPKYQTEGSAGMDLQANIAESVVIAPNSSAIIPTGIHMQLPKRAEAQIRSRSGMAFNYDIIAYPGTIDNYFTGEIMVKLYNLSNKDFTVNPGDRIAQMVVSRYDIVRWDLVDELTETERGEGGFGSTGK